MRSPRRPQQNTHTHTYKEMVPSGVFSLEQSAVLLQLLIVKLEIYTHTNSVKSRLTNVFTRCET